MAGHLDFSGSSTSSDVAARCLSLVDARLEEMSDAPEETGEGSSRQLLKGATGYDTQLTSSTLVPFSLSQVWGVDEYERTARDTTIELYTDPILQRNNREYLRFIKKLDRLHVLRWRCILRNA